MFSSLLPFFFFLSPFVLLLTSLKRKVNHKLCAKASSISDYINLVDPHVSCLLLYSYTLYFPPPQLFFIYVYIRCIHIYLYICFIYTDIWSSSSSSRERSFGSFFCIMFSVLENAGTNTSQVLLNGGSTHRPAGEAVISCLGWKCMLFSWRFLYFSLKHMLSPCRQAMCHRHVLTWPTTSQSGIEETEQRPSNVC